MADKASEFNSKPADFGSQYVYSREELDRMKRRAEIRQRLKNEFYSYYKNPLVGSYMIDTVSIDRR